jgi:hypothetical protein
VTAKGPTVAARIAELTKWAAQLDVALASIAGEVGDLRARIGDPHNASAPEPKGSEAPVEGTQPSDAVASFVDWVDWLARAFGLSERFPSCWCKHEGVVTALQALRRWHAVLQRGDSSDPTSAILWTDAVMRVDDRLLRRVSQRCLSTHHDPPGIDAPTEDELDALNRSWASRRL